MNQPGDRPARRRVLIMSTEAWDDTNSGGNTFSNLFSGTEELELSHVYCRDAAPSNHVCRHYHRISTKMLLRHILRPSRIGKSFEWSPEDTPRPASAGEATREKKLISLIHRYNVKAAYWMENLLWRLGGWRNDKFDRFLAERSPDVIFTFAIPTLPRKLLLDHIQKKTGAKVVLFIADHVCHRYMSSDRKRGRAAVRRMKQMLRSADKVYAITDELTEAYSREFGVDISILRKGCSFDTPVSPTVGDPLRMVYAGNLLYGRMEILRHLVETIARINRDGEQISLEIYSGTHIEDADRESLTIPGASSFMGARPFGEIRRILAESDIVLHVESFEKKQIEYIKYSFSTKITDALECGKNFMVIGPRGISSVEYTRRIPGVIVIDDLAETENALRTLLEDKSLIPRNAESIRAYARENHAGEHIHARLYADLAALCDTKES